MYKCTHCNEKLASEKGPINIDFIIKHVRFHDLNLYKCKYCTFVHNLKHKVDRHVSDKHSEKPSLVIIVREMEQELEENQEPEGVKETKPWKCSMCKYRSATRDEVAVHVYNKHNLDMQHKCALCNYRTSKRETFKLHFETQHPNQKTDIIDAYYEVPDHSNVQKHLSDHMYFDTTPIWQRDKTKFKHIRGIPLEEYNKSNKKILNKSGVDNLKSVESIGSGSSKNEKDIFAVSILKKPKTLKEKKLELSRTEALSEVIEIEDDNEKEKVITRTVKQSPKNKQDPLDDLLDSKRNEVYLSNNVAAQEAEKKVSNCTLQDIEEMDIHTLKKLDLSGTYGPYGKPFNKSFVCPLCDIFRTKKSLDMTNHLYKDLHYPR